MTLKDERSPAGAELSGPSAAISRTLPEDLRRPKGFLKAFLGM